MESVTCVQLCPLLQMSLPWLGSVCDVEEPLRNPEAAAAVIKSLGGSPANAAFSNGFDNCMSFFFSLTEAILIFSGLDALHQHFLALKVPEQSLFSVALCCFSTFCLFSHRSSASC